MYDILSGGTYLTTTANTGKAAYIGFLMERDSHRIYAMQWGQPHYKVVCETGRKAARMSQCFISTHWTLKIGRVHQERARERVPFKWVLLVETECQRCMPKQSEECLIFKVENIYFSLCAVRQAI